VSVHITYRGRFGNHAFQYCCARLFGRDSGLRVMTEFPEFDRQILPVTEHEEGRVITNPKVTLTGGKKSFLGTRYPPAQYTLKGFFQWPEVYQQRRDDVMKIFRPRPVKPRPDGDIVINVRAGKDYRDLGMLIHPSWYLAILVEEQFDQLFIVTDAPDPKYLEYFKQYCPIVVKTTPDKDWDFLRSFRRILCANSTFPWWAAFFGYAWKVYTFERWCPSISQNPRAWNARTLKPVKGLYWHEWPVVK
jgi:hypothetical protein